MKKGELRVSAAAKARWREGEREGQKKRGFGPRCNRDGVPQEETEGTQKYMLS